MLMLAWSMSLIGTAAQGGLPHPGVGDDEAASGAYEARLTCDAGAPRVLLEVNGEPRATLPASVVRCASDVGGSCRFLWDDCASGSECDHSIVIVKPDTELSLAESDATVVFACRAGPGRSRDGTL